MKIKYFSNSEINRLYKQHGYEKTFNFLKDNLEILRYHFMKSANTLLTNEEKNKFKNILLKQEIGIIKFYNENYRKS